jgi:arylsulfatase
MSFELGRIGRVWTRLSFTAASSGWKIGTGCLISALLMFGSRATGAAQPQREGAPRPNIILIMSDDMGYSDIGCYGGEIRTPILDRLAAGGLRFSQFYNMARCCPTRASLMTGLHPHQAGMGHMTGAPKDRTEPWQGDLSQRAVTIAEVLRGAGYSTYMCGKWHVTRSEQAKGKPHNWPLQRGFDRFYGTITGAGSFYDPVTLTRDNVMITPENDPEYHPDHFYYTDAISDNAVKLVADHANQQERKPFFLYVAYTAAHWPMHAPEESIARYRGRYDKGYRPIRTARFQRLKELGLIDPAWELSRQAGNWRSVEHKAWEARCMEVYAAMIDRMDEGIGRIVSQLEKSEMLENTLILFLQDNGGCAEPMGRDDKPEWHLTDLKPMGPDELQTRIWPPMQTRDGRPLLGGPQVMPGGPDTYIAYGRSWANVSNTPFREYKHWVHEGGISTPLIAHWPKGIPRRGEIEHQPGQVIDIMVTCVDLAGARYPARYNGNDVRPMEGASLVPAFTGKTIDREAIYWEHEGNRAIRIGQWKLVAKGPGGQWELYDMDRDRTELHDLAAQHPERVADMARKWEAWALRAGVLPWIWEPPYEEVKR